MPNNSAGENFFHNCIFLFNLKMTFFLKNKIIWQLFFNFFVVVAFAQNNFWIPDPVFRQYLIDKLPSQLFENDSLIISEAEQFYPDSNSSFLRSVDVFSSFFYHESELLFQIEYNSDLYLNSIDGIQYFKNLEGFVFYNQCIYELPVFDSDNQIQYIDCNNCCLNVFNNLNFPNLKYLNISNNNIQNMPNLSFNQNLLLFVCGNCNLENLEIIENNSSLRWIYVPLNNFIEDLNLSFFLDLEAFDCLRCNISNFPNIYNNLKLIDLRLNENQITTIPSLIANKNIKYLGLYQNKIKDITEIIHLDSLTDLVVSENEIEEIPYVSHLEKFHNILASKNKLKVAPILPPPIDFFESVLFIYWINDNEIDELPNFEIYEAYLKKRGAFDLRMNRLDFSDAYQIKYLDSIIGYDTNLGGIDVMPQKPFGTRDTFYFPMQVDTFISIASQQYATHYQWFKNGVPIEGATDTALHFKYILPSDEGNYTCKSYSNYLTNLRLLDDITEFESEIKTVRTTPALENKPIINLYPNPTSDILNIAVIIRTQQEKVKISYTDILGKKIDAYSATHKRGRATIEINVNNLKTGVYLFEIFIENRKYIEKVVVSK